MYLEPECKVKLRDLIQGAIIHSGNDACITIAEGIAGTEEAFANLMTQRAREMGLEKATFKNSTGLYRSRAQDLGSRTCASRRVHHPEVPGLLQHLQSDVVHLEQHHAAEPQPSPHRISRRRRPQDGFRQGERLRARRIGRAESTPPAHGGLRPHLDRRTARGSAEAPRLGVPAIQTLQSPMRPARRSVRCGCGAARSARLRW